MKVLGKPTLLTNYDTAHSQIKQKVDGYITDLSIAGIVDGMINLYCNDNMREGLEKKLFTERL